MRSNVTFRPQNVEAIRRGPVDFLLSWIQSPDVDGHRVLANRLPFLFAPVSRQFSIDATADLAPEAATPADLTRAVSSRQAIRAVIAWWWNAGSVGLLTRTSGDNLDTALIEVALVVDDRTEHLAGKDQTADGWREWLRISNSLNLREQPTIITALSDVTAGAVADHAKPRTVRDTEFDFALPPEWQSAHDLAASGAERAFIDQFARHAQRDAGQSIPAPVVGYEAEDGIPIDFAWPDREDSRLPGPRTLMTGVSWKWRAGACSPMTRMPSSQR